MIKNNNEEVRTDYCISCDEIKEIFDNEFDLCLCMRCWLKYVKCNKDIK